MSKDRKTLFSCSADRTIKIWNTNRGQLKSTLTGHTDSVLTLAISSSERFLISGSADKTIRIWDLTIPDSKPQILTGHDNWVTAIAITSDDKYLVSCSTDSTIKLWNLETQEIVDTLTDHFDKVWSVSISPDDQTLASGSLDKTVKLWDLATGTLLQTLQASSPVIFSETGKYLITGNSKNQIEIWQRLSENHQLINNTKINNQWWLILGVERNATRTEIKNAYYNLARQYHPDLNNSVKAQQMMQIINQAYYQLQIELDESRAK